MLCQKVTLPNHTIGIFTIYLKPYSCGNSIQTQKIDSFYKRQQVDTVTSKNTIEIDILEVLLLERIIPFRYFFLSLSQKLYIFYAYNYKGQIGK
jgi:hypothetical protein